MISKAQYIRMPVYESSNGDFPEGNRYPGHGNSIVMNSNRRRRQTHAELRGVPESGVDSSHPPGVDPNAFLARFGINEHE